MGLFDIFKRGGKDKASKPAQQKAPQAPPPAPPDNKAKQMAQSFEQEFMAALPRYFSSPGLSGNFNFTHPDTGRPISVAEAFPEHFEVWQGIRSFADRRCVIFEVLDQICGKELAGWQYIERLIEAREVEIALEIAETHEADHADDADFWAARAKAYLIHYEYAAAEAAADKALALAPDSIRARRIKADILHVTKRCDDAHAIYDSIIKEKIPADQKIELPLGVLLGFDGDMLNSPIYAFDWLNSDPKVPDDMWDWASEEFFYSPHFRAQHAYRLIQKGDTLKGLAKLLALANEMPWFKEAVLNVVSVIDQLGMQEQLAKERAQYAAIIEQNGWTTSGMNEINF